MTKLAAFDPDRDFFVSIPSPGGLTAEERAVVDVQGGLWPVRITVFEVGTHEFGVSTPQGQGVKAIVTMASNVARDRRELLEGLRRAHHDEDVPAILSMSKRLVGLP